MDKITKQRLDKKDKLLLASLEKGVRSSTSELAKRSQLSRTAAEYRLERLKESGVIRGHYCVLNPTLLGLAVWEVWFSLRPKQERSKFLNEIRKNPLVWWQVECVGEYDAMACILCRSSEELTTFLADVEHKHANLIRDTAAVLTVNFEHHTRGFLLGKQSEQLGSARPGHPVKLSSTQKKVLKILSVDARAHLAQLAVRTNLNVKTVRTAIQELQEEGVIVCFRAALDPTSLGVEYYKVLVNLRNPHGGVSSSALSWCRHHPNVTGMFFCVGPWQLELDIEIGTYRQLCEVVQELRDRMDVRRYEIVLVTNSSSDLNTPPTLGNV